jgi:hypothetical protein
MNVKFKLSTIFCCLWHVHGFPHCASETRGCLQASYILVSITPCCVILSYVLFRNLTRNVCGAAETNNRNNLVLLAVYKRASLDYSVVRAILLKRKSCIPQGYILKNYF